jgi:hypothetical protein
LEWARPDACWDGLGSASDAPWGLEQVLQGNQPPEAPCRLLCLPQPELESWGRRLLAALPTICPHRQRKRAPALPRPLGITDRGDRIRTCDLVLPKPLKWGLPDRLLHLDSDPNNPGCHCLLCLQDVPGSRRTCQAETAILLQILLQGVSCVPDSLDPCRRPPPPPAKHGQPRTVAGLRLCGFRWHQTSGLAVAGPCRKCADAFF